MEYFQVVIWASEAHFCHRLYNYSYNLQGYWVDVSQQKSVLVESGDVYLIQKPQYKLGSICHCANRVILQVEQVRLHPWLEVGLKVDI